MTASPPPLSPDALRVLEAQLVRMRGMLFRYYDLFFRFVSGGLVASGALFIGAFWQPTQAAALLLPFVILYVGFHAANLFSYVIFARTHAAALSHESELRLALGARGSDVPIFDLIWLGMGPDGHTASLFPGSMGLDEQERWVIGNWAPSQEAWRMTLTFPVLNAGRDVIFVVTGADKADALRDIRAGGSDLPAGRVAGDQVEWIIDAAADTGDAT